MHVKGGWVRRTFALAKCNDSGGTKLRIRRSKEERKALVESFIKKYQKLNNGNFPPLTLTYKEVGGSYYIVREIFRKVIQENRVLGPAKFTPGDQRPDRFFKQHPSGSVFIEPEADLSLSNESHVVTHILPSHQDTSEEPVLNSSVQCPEHEHERFDEGKIVNVSSWSVEKNEEYDKAVYTESRARESLELEENVAELGASKAKVTHVAADVMVGTFPLTSGSRITYGLDEKSREHGKVTGTLVEEEIGKLEMEAGYNNSVVDETNFLDSDLSNKKTEAILAGSLLENSNGSTTKGSIIDTNGGTDPGVKDASPAGIKVTYDLDSIRAQNLNGINTRSSCEKSNSAEVIDGKNNSNIQNDGSSLNGSNSTLDRMNLESWETSEKSARQQSKPLMASFKSFVAAAVAKFWSK